MKPGDGTGFIIEQLKTLHPPAEAVVISRMEDEQHALRAFELEPPVIWVKKTWFGTFPKRRCRSSTQGHPSFSTGTTTAAQAGSNHWSHMLVRASSGGKTLKESRLRKDVLKMVARLQS
jgi:hypothetical protein